MGAFAAAPIQKGRLVATTDDAWILRSSKHGRTRRWRKWLIYSSRDAGRTIFLRGPMKFVNHGCDPNIEWLGDRCFSLRDIAAGEELLENYSDFANHRLRIQCRCGAAMCRGIVTGKGHRVELS
jgi:hypothetical protein